MKFFIKDFFSKCEQICSKLRVLKKSSMKKSVFCTVSHYQTCNTFSPSHNNICITLFTQIFSWRRSFKLIFFTSYDTVKLFNNSASISSVFSCGLIISLIFVEFTSGECFPFTILLAILFPINSPVASVPL